MKKQLGLFVLQYLRFFAKLQLKKYAPDIIGITGSSGKTTTRNAVHAILKDKYTTKVSFKANTESGLPLNILGLSPTNYSVFDWIRIILFTPIMVLVNWKPFEKYVVEMGIDSPHSPKNMEFLLTIVRPRTGIFLNVLPVHVEAFAGGVRAIAVEKGKLIRSLPPQGLAIVNADDILALAEARGIKAQVMTFGKHQQADIRIGDTTYSGSGTTFHFISKYDSTSLTVAGLLPAHFAYSFAAALCINLDEGNTLNEGCKLLAKNFTLPPGRMSVFQGIRNSIIIDSTYNASAQPTIDALNMLPQVPGNRKVAVLGDMRELGTQTQSQHEKVINTAMKTCDQLVLVGNYMKEFALPYLKRFNYSNVQWFINSRQAGYWLKDNIEKGDAVLFKGSQNTIYLESALEQVLENPDDTKRLCRRGAYWDQLRSKIS